MNELLTLLPELQAKARMRWAAYSDEQDKLFDGLCQAYADLAAAAGIDLDPESPLVLYGVDAGSMQQRWPMAIEDAVSQAMVWLAYAFNAAMASNDRLDDYVEATSVQIQLLGGEG